MATRWTSRFFSGVVGLAVALGASRAAAEDVVFSQGSLIIPMQSSFQSPCGVLSSYGLVWTLLRENDSDNGGYFTVAGRHKITIYEVVRPTKNSPNRCVPSNLHTKPATGTLSQWNDGCDFSITGSAGVPPVVPVPAGGPANPAGNLFTPAAKIPFFDLTTAASDGLALPEYGLPPGYGSPANLTQVNYMGSPFIINASDAPEVLNFINSKMGTYDVAKFATYDAAAEASCLSYSNLATQAAVAPAALLGGANAPINQTYHFVQLHQAQVGFTAPVARRISVTPPKIALLNKKHSGTTSGTVSSTLDPYLKSAGLFFTGTGATTHTDSAGCPLDSQNAACTNNGSTATLKYPGVIYDEFAANIDFLSAKYNGTDYPNGLLNATGADGTPRYVVFWAPHWDLGDSAYSTAEIAGTALYKAPTPAPVDQKTNVINNVAFFAQQKGSGIMLECASIRVLENQSSNPALFLSTTGINESGGQGVTDVRNCDDPDRPAGTICGTFTNNSNLFAQIGDFRLHRVNGTVASWQPKTTLQPSNYTLAVRYGDGTDTGNTPDTTGGVWQLINTGLYQGNNQMANIVYVGGHDYSGGTQGDNGQLQIAGTRVVLNTLLNLAADPIPAERAIAAPVSFVDPNQSNKIMVFSPTYEGISGIPNSATNYIADPLHNGAAAKDWRFPYNTGHLWVQDLSLMSAGAFSAGQTSAGDNVMGSGKVWDANEKLPAPGDRNLFTFLAGAFVTPATPSATRTALIGTRPLIHGAAQGGWVPEAFDYRSVQPPCAIPANSCVNRLKWAAGTNGNDLDLVYDAAGDNFCDLQQLVHWTNLNAGNDFGPVCNANNGQKLVTDVTSVQALIQRVRGFCYAKDASGAFIPEPIKSQCDPGALDRSNKAHLGGIVHSTPAVIGASPHVLDAPSGVSRPTVAYVGALDGQLHAFYVSGGAGYTGPSAAIKLPNPTANSEFMTDYSAVPFAPPAAGTELWSFIPASQLQLLSTNNARVDSSPVVQDVFVDLTGTGVREWHTVLVASVGPGGREVFAMDITNPLKPSLWWDLVGSNEPISGFTAQYSPVPLANGLSGGDAFPYVWNQDTSAYAFASGITSTPYDLTKLGGSSGIALGQLRAGLAPVYSVFVTSSRGSTSQKGIQAFALDAATGQKVWEWSHDYDLTAFAPAPAPSKSVADNGIPPVGSLYDFGLDDKRFYVGDMEGRLWELDAATGQNKNLSASSTPVGLPAFDTGSVPGSKQPITTNIAIARVPSTLDAGTDFIGFQNANIAVFGTAGDDWVPDSSPGKVHIALLDTRYRVPFAAGGFHLDGVTPWMQPDALTFASGHDSGGAARGVLQEVPAFPIVFSPVAGVAERIFGGITVAGQALVFNTAKGSMPGDLNTMPATTGGGSYMLKLSDSTAAGVLAYGGTGARYGGTAVVTDSSGTPVYLVSDQVTQVSVTSLSAAEKQPFANDSTLAVNSPGNGILYKLVTWFQRFLP